MLKDYSILLLPHHQSQKVPSSKLPKGRHLSDDRVSYDIDVRLPGEGQPQLDVTPITKYGSDPGLVVGRQIAVNKAYICYGLKLGAIRVLNIHTALRSLLKRVTDMVFFAEDVHVLVSASIDGRVYVWKIQKGQMKMTSHKLQGRLLLRFRSQEKGNLFILEFVGPFLTPGVVLCFLLFLCCALLALGLHLEFFL